MKSLFFFFALYAYSFANSHIFVYHRFDDFKHPSTNTSIKELKKQFEYFKNNNYKVVPLSKIIDKIKNKQDIPSNWVALTVDDSYKSFYTNALEVFKKYKYHFTIYVYVKAVEDNYKDFTTWDELKEIQKYGDIGLHSYAHDHFLKISNDELIEDTKKSLNLIQKNLGFKPNTYVYPYGEYNQRIQNTIKSFGFEAILNQSTGAVTKDSDICDINRIALVGKSNIKEKLKYKTFDVKWIEPKIYPKNGILRKVKAKVDPKIKNLELYISSYGWQNIKVNDGLVDINLNLKLNKKRTRVILGRSIFKISNKLLVKN